MVDYDDTTLTENTRWYITRIFPGLISLTKVHSVHIQLNILRMLKSHACRRATQQT